jgi:hypothetical protein
MLHKLLRHATAQGGPGDGDVYGFGHAPDLGTRPIWARARFGHAPDLATRPIWARARFGCAPDLGARPIWVPSQFEREKDTRTVSRLQKI